jgi:RimJ/RimL family protein N-acetyltransferase
MSGEKTPEQRLLQTRNLTLVLQTRDAVRALIDEMTPYEKAQLSADWLVLFEASNTADPWVHGFSAVHRDSGTVVGTGSFKGPPSHGVVEIAYGIYPDHRGKGYATEVAEALATYAFSFANVRTVRAHTLPEPNASTRVLAKCGFTRVGDVVDPEDGLVWRFEKLRA